MAAVFASPAQFLDEIAAALGLKARDILEVTIRSRWDDIVRIEVEMAMVEDQDRKVAGVLRRYTLTPIDSDEQSPAPMADTLTPAPFDPTPAQEIQPAGPKPKVNRDARMGPGRPWGSKDRGKIGPEMDHPIESAPTTPFDPTT